MLSSPKSTLRIGFAARRTDRRANSTLTALGLIVIAGVVLYYLAFRGQGRPDGSDTPDAALAHPAAGVPLVGFNVSTLTGDGPDVFAGNLGDKVVLVSFWGPWCPPCRSEFPHLAELAEKLRDRHDFLWLPVTYGPGGNQSPQQLRQEASAFLARSGLKTVTYHDPQQSLVRAATAAGAFQNSFPCTVLLDRSGLIHAVWNGYSPGTEKQIEAAVVELLQ